MKKIVNYILAGVLSLGVFTACDLETSPTTSLDAGAVFSSPENAEKVLNGSWKYLLETFSTYANPGFGTFLRASDAMGSDVVVNTKYGFASSYTFTAIYNKTATNTLSWTLAYNTINSVNNVIASVDEATADKRQVKGQAYALRGFIYLHLASLYSFSIDKDPNAVSVPIYTEPSNATTEGQPAASVKEVYAQAISDLENALALIPEDYSRNAKFKIDNQVVLGLLSRATLYAREWQKAKTYSDQLLAKNNYLMNEAEYKGGFNDISNKEWLWGHPQTAEQSSASYQFHYLDVTSTSSYYYSFNADPYFADLFEDGDYRKDLMYWEFDPGVTPAANALTYFRYAKFKFRQPSVADIVLMRTSEIYLINAEAKARLNDPDAVNKLNDLKRARGAQTVSVSGQDLLDAIWLERRKELFGEGFSLVDIIRNQQTVVRREYPQTPKLDLGYKDKDGKPVELIPQGHRIVRFPDNSAFVANSKYYIFRIPDTEERDNANLYKNHPKLAIYQ
ncbi:membrane protein [Bacteroidia bacterium]|nr:membrane protein [Bacteroidia bacterium]